MSLRPFPTSRCISAPDHRAVRNGTAPPTAPKQISSTTALRIGARPSWSRIPKSRSACPWVSNGPAAATAISLAKKDPNWGGFVIATDADTGQVKWRFRTMAPALSGVTPTKGGLVFVGDLANHAWAFDADSGKVLWQSELPGAAGGGVVSYLVDGRQKIAFVAGTRSPIFPVATASAKIVIFGLQ